MAPTVPPPPPMPNSTPGPHNPDLLATTLNQTYELIHQIAFPKTKTAKTNISILEKLDAISAHIGLTSKQSDKCTYASVLTSAAPPSSAPPKLTTCRTTRLDLTLTQADRKTPVFTDLSEEDLLDKIQDAIIEAKCWFETLYYSPDIDGKDNFENVPPRIRA
ncbi:hypothetical protein K439DRAFT_1635247, partial [Ramaria rubella]